MPAFRLLECACWGGPILDPTYCSFAELKGKTAVVTGSSSGIGREIALQLASGGADVVVHGRSQQRLQSVLGKIEALGGVAVARCCDLSAPEADLKAFVSACADWRDGIDIWVNNAGCDVLTGPLATAAFDVKLQRLWEVDVRGTMLLSRLAGRRMKQGGTILNIGWDQADVGMAGDSGEMFAATKGAIMAFTRSLAKSLAPDVRVNCLCPGWIKTAWGESASAEWQHRAQTEALVRRWGTVDDVAKMARYLVSDDAAFVNGQIIHVNGGFSGSAE